MFLRQSLSASALVVVSSDCDQRSGRSRFVRNRCCGRRYLEPRIQCHTWPWRRRRLFRRLVRRRALCRCWCHWYWLNGETRKLFKVSFSGGKEASLCLWAKLIDGVAIALEGVDHEHVARAVTD